MIKKGNNKKNNSHQVHKWKAESPRNNIRKTFNLREKSYINLLILHRSNYIIHFNLIAVVNTDNKFLVMKHFYLQKYDLFTCV